MPAALEPALSHTDMLALVWLTSGRHACAIVRTTLRWFSPAVMCASTGRPSFTRAWSLSTMICGRSSQLTALLHLTLPTPTTGPDSKAVLAGVLAVPCKHTLREQQEHAYNSGKVRGAGVSATMYARHTTIARFGAHLHCNRLAVVGALEDPAEGAAAEHLPQLQAQEGDAVGNPRLGGGGPRQEAALGGPALQVQQGAHAPGRLHARRRNLRSSSSPMSRTVPLCCIMSSFTAGCRA